MICLLHRDHPNDTTPYHYYGNTGNITRTECEYYTKSETRLTSGHLFVTEKYIFGRWAQKYNITFVHPSWKAKVYNQSKLDTPFMKLYREKKLTKLKNRTQQQQHKSNSKTGGANHVRLSIGETRSTSFDKIMTKERPDQDNDGIFIHVGGAVRNNSVDRRHLFNDLSKR